MRHRTIALLALQSCTALTGVLVAASSSNSATTDVAFTRSASIGAVLNVRPVQRALLRPTLSAAPATVAPRRTTRSVRPLPAPARSTHRRPSPPIRIATTRPRPTPSSTPQQRLDQAIARIPGYQAVGATWLLQANDGYWGTADWYHNVIWISPHVPAARVYDVAVHEWSHLRSVKSYDGNVDLAISEMNRFFGGSGLVGAERAADCMARLNGAGWTHYTSCQNADWRKGAARLLAGRRL